MIKKIYKVLEPNEQEKLSLIFPALEKFRYHGTRLCTYYADTEEILHQHGYKWFYVSVYDHWLDANIESDKDALEEFFKYNDYEHPKSSLLSQFNLHLYQQTKVLNYRPIGRKNCFNWRSSVQKISRISFRKFSNFEKFKFVAGKPENYLFPYLVLPELQAVYFPGKDLNHLLIYRDESLLHQFKQWVTDSNLYTRK